MSESKYLTFEEERMRIQFIQDNKDSKDEKIKFLINKYKEDILKSTYGLVVAYAKKMKENNVLKLDDYVNRGLEGVLTAIDKFDLSRNLRFSTYAFYYIKQKIDRSSATINSVEIPEHIRQLRYQYIYLDQKDLTELEKKNIVERYHKFNLDNTFNPISLDTPIKSNEESTTLMHYIASDEATPEDIAIEKSRKEAIMKGLNKLTDKEKYIILCRFGIDCEQLTLDAIGGKLKITRERVRQIESKALKKLKFYINLN